MKIDTIAKACKKHATIRAEQIQHVEASDIALLFVMISGSGLKGIAKVSMSLSRTKVSLVADRLLT